MKIRAHKEIPMFQSKLAPGVYRADEDTFYGVARNAAPEPGYYIAGRQITKTNFDYHVSNGDVEIIQEDEMTNLPAVAKPECDVFAIMDKTVSYTHLTLPTICSV